MTGRIRAVSSWHREVLASGWEIASSPAGAKLEPDAVSNALAWHPAKRLAPVAAILRDDWPRDSAAQIGRIDGCDWWFRLRFAAPVAPSPDAHFVLGFDGLATVADTWLNNQHLLHSVNMFHEHEIDVTARLAHSNELLLRFTALDWLLQQKRPRPRWKTPMVENQQLRWFRTTLLGRTPGWSPPVAAAGAWRPVWLEVRSDFAIDGWSARTHVRGSTGIIDATCRISLIGETSLSGVTLVAMRGGRSWRTPLLAEQRSDIFRASLAIHDVELWWPHTHGEPALYDLHLEVAIKGRHAPVEVRLTSAGFRSVRVETGDGNFALHVNDVPVFCRGACWTPLDCASLRSEGSQLDAAVAQVRAAGMNMLRVGGTMTYEDDGFFDACDRAGILVWQDFMFASMDYPQEDPAFIESVTIEARQQLTRFGSRAALAVLCGNSEAEQQASMSGASREHLRQPLFDVLLPQQCAELAPDVAYWPSSAHRGAFPHQPNAGTTSYYGVGAYRRPLSDARHAEVRFASECLAFANIPEESALAMMSAGKRLKVHSPEWKAAVPRDLGAGWDFEDVRDHYLREFFDLDPTSLRSCDHDRYLELSRVVSGTAMAAAFREWRRGRSSCNGALVWFLRDLVPGAGWGIVDSTGTRKAAWYQLRRVLQPRAVLLTDEGLNGLQVHVINEPAQALSASIEIEVYRDDGVRVARATRELTAPARGNVEFPVLELFESFLDLTYAYRFGPPGHEVVVAALHDHATGQALSEDCYFPLGMSAMPRRDIGLAAVARLLDSGDAELTLTASACARFVSIRQNGFVPEDQYFHLIPGRARTLRLRRVSPSAEVNGYVYALNSAEPVRIGSAA